MAVPPLFAGDGDRLSTIYSSPLSFVLLVLLLLVIRRRAVQIARPSPFYGLAPPSLLGRVPHVLCCLLLSGYAIAAIACDATLLDQDVLPSSGTDPASIASAQSSTQTLYSACLACEAVMWALCATLVLAEQRHGKHSSRSLRVWWLVCLAVSIAKVVSEIVRLVYELSQHTHHTLADHGWTVVRIATLVPTFYLALIAILAPDTPTDEDDAEPYSSTIGAPGGINAMAQEPLLVSTPSSIEHKTPPRSVELTASFASKATFSYMTPLLSLGKNRALEHSDLFDLAYEDSTAYNAKLLQDSLDKGGSFIRCLHRVYGPYFWLTGSMQLINTTCTFANPVRTPLCAHTRAPRPRTPRPPHRWPTATERSSLAPARPPQILLNEIVSWINAPEGEKPYSTAVAITLATGMFVANTIKSLVLGQYFWRGFRLGLRCRASIGQVVYAKALSLAHDGRQEFGVGGVCKSAQNGRGGTARRRRTHVRAARSTPRRPMPTHLSPMCVRVSRSCQLSSPTARSTRRRLPIPLHTCTCYGKGPSSWRWPHTCCTTTLAGRASLPSV